MPTLQLIGIANHEKRESYDRALELIEELNPEVIFLEECIKHRESFQKKDFSCIKSEFSQTLTQTLIYFYESVSEKELIPILPNDLPGSLNTKSIAWLNLSYSLAIVKEIKKGLAQKYSFPIGGTHIFKQDSLIILIKELIDIDITSHNYLKKINSYWTTHLNIKRLQDITFELIDKIKTKDEPINELERITLTYNDFLNEIDY